MAEFCAYVSFFGHNRIRWERLRWTSVRSLHDCFPEEKGIARCRTVLCSDPEPMQRSPAGTTAATAGGRPSQPAEDLRREKRCRTSMPGIAQPLPAQCRGHRHRSKSGRSFCRHRAVDVLARGRMLVGREAVGRFLCGSRDPLLRVRVALGDLVS